MKYVCISDTHGAHRSKKINRFLMGCGADVLLFAGDLQRNSFDDGTDFVDWLFSLPFRYCVCTFGNHDNNSVITQEYIVSKGYQPKITFLHNESVTLDGVTYWGSPNTRVFMNWSHMKTEKELAEIYAKIPDKTNIMITHSPPAWILDEARDKSLGSWSLLDWILKMQRDPVRKHTVKMLVCGHIHAGYGTLISPDGAQLYVNASIMNEQYNPVNDPIVVEID